RPPTQPPAAWPGRPARGGREPRGPPRPARRNPWLAHELHGAQVPRPDLVRPARDPPVEGGRASQRQGDRLAFAELQVGDDPIALRARRLERDPLDVVERHAETAA